MSAKVPTNGAKALTMNAKPLRNRVNFPLSVYIPSGIPNPNSFNKFMAYYWSRN